MQVPIYVNKQIISTDAIRIIYGAGKARDTKSVYDVVLDRYCCACSKGLGFHVTSFYWTVPLSMSEIFSSASDGPDLVAEELDLVRNMKKAITEERYNDAGMFQIKHDRPSYY